MSVCLARAVCLVCPAEGYTVMCGVNRRRSAESSPCARAPPLYSRRQRGIWRLGFTRNPRTSWTCCSKRVKHTDLSHRDTAASVLHEFVCELGSACACVRVPSEAQDATVLWCFKSGSASAWRKDELSCSCLRLGIYISARVWIMYSRCVCVCVVMFLVVVCVCVCSLFLLLL